MSDKTEVFDLQPIMLAGENSAEVHEPSGPESLDLPGKKPPLPSSFAGTRYELLGLLGQGGAGKVFKALDRERDNEPVAIKVLAPQDHGDPLALIRFQRELEATRDFRHQNIVKIFDYGKNRLDQYYITMEYVSGGTLADRIHNEEAPLGFEETLRILHAVASGIAHAHSRDIVHRDLKPANILLGADGAVKVTDFGMARHTKPGNTITESSCTLGTPEYMAPEQFQSSHVDKPADIYALGLIAYEMATGKRPFPQGQYLDMAKAHVNMPMPKCATSESGIPKWFGTFVSVCTNKRAGERYDSMDDVVKSLTSRMKKMGLLENETVETAPLWARIAYKLLGIN